MATARKRLTLDIDEGLQRRLKAAAALKGVSMRKFCETALEKGLNHTDAQLDREARRRSVEELFEQSRRITGGRKFPGNSADIIREEREIRADQIDNRI